jgi:hypothetical protein
MMPKEGTEEVRKGYGDKSKMFQKSSYKRRTGSRYKKNALLVVEGKPEG